MNLRRAIALVISFICVALVLLSAFYMESSAGKTATLLISGLVAALFLVLGLRPARQTAERSDAVVIVPRGRITELVLLSDEDTEIAQWEIYGKNGLIIGKDYGENNVDINLIEAAYSSMIDVEHAVLNYTAEDWYVEDLDSKNGIVIQKSADGRKYRIDSGTPCKLDPGDIIFLGMTRLQVQ